MKVMSREGSCDAAHCMVVSSPTLTSALDGAKVIFVESEETSGQKKGKMVDGSAVRYVALT